MKILHTVEFYEPSKGGAQEVIKQISERLVGKGHDVTVATSHHPARSSTTINNVRIEQFEISGNSVRGINGKAKEYQAFLCDTKFDVLLNYAAQTWTTDLTFPLLDKIAAKKVIAPLGYSRLTAPRYRNYFSKLPDVLAKYDTLIYTSPNYQDALFGKQHGLERKARIIRNGAAREEFEQSRQNFKTKYGINETYFFLSVSNHYFAKGHTRVLNAFRKLNSNDCALVLIGEKPVRHSWYSCYPVCKASSWMDRRIKVLSGIPRSDVVAAYQEADLFLFGSEVECSPLVMYEAFASRTPFITTNVGNVLDHAEYLRVIESSEQMLDELKSFVRDPTPYRALADRAYQLFLQDHTWERITKELEDLYKGLVGV